MSIFKKYQKGEAIIINSYIFQQIMSMQNNFAQSCLLKNVDVFLKENAIFIINVNNLHWRIMHLDNSKRTLSYHDSLHFDCFEYLTQASKNLPQTAKRKRMWRLFNTQCKINFV